EGLLGVLGVEPRREVDAGGERLDALALAVLGQALEVDAAPGGLLGVGGGVAEGVGVIAEAGEDLRRQFGGVGLAHTGHTNNRPKGFVGSNGVVLIPFLASLVAIERLPATRTGRGA